MQAASKIAMRTKILYLFRALAAIILAVASLPASAAFTFSSTSGSNFFTDTSATTQLRCNYQSYNVTSTTAVASAWAQIGSFTGGYLGLGGGDDGKYNFGAFYAGETKPVFFYVCSTYTTRGIVAGNGYTLTVYDRNPSTPGVLTLGSAATSSITIDNSVIEANPNQVHVIFSGPNPAQLGGIITLSVEGDTGTIGCVNPPSACAGATAGPLTFTPAAYTNWRADAYELIGSTITLSDNASNAGVYENQLMIPTVASAATTHYVAQYYFRAILTTSTAVSLSPVGYLASGTQIKHTPTDSGAYAGALMPISPASNTSTLAKLVNPATLPNAGGGVTYTVRITNAGTDPVTLDSVVDALPPSVVYVVGSSTFNSVAIANPTISGSTLTWERPFVIPAFSFRDLIFQATIPATAGTYVNAVTARIGTTVIDTTLSTGDNVPATATTRVLLPPTITKSFLPVNVVAGGSSVLTMSVSYPIAVGSAALSGVAVSDTYPAAIVNAAIPNAATTCTGGTVASTGGSVSLTGASIASGESCTASINVTSSTLGAHTNTTGTVTSSNGGTGGTASAVLNVTIKPTVSKSFSVPSIPQGGTATLTFTVTNNGATPITNLAFTDLFPLGLLTANPPAVAPASPCGGSLLAWNGTATSALNAGGGNVGVALSAGSIAASGGTCTFSVNVTASGAGTYNNTASGATSTESGAAGPASNTATLLVLAPPTVSKSFTPSTIGRGQTSVLNIVLTNPNATPITGAAFTDTYPGNVTNAATPAASSTCGGSVTAAASGPSVALAGGVIPASGSCTVAVTVTSNTVNNAGYVNTIPAGGLTTTNAGSNTAPTSATLIVNATPAITKSFTVNTATGVTTLTLVIANNHTAGISGLSFTDTFPFGMAVDATPALSNTCNGTITGATSGSTSFSLAAGSIAGASPATCTISLAVRLNAGGVFNNQTTGVTLTAPFAGTGSPSNIATLIAPIIVKTFTPGTVGPGDVSRMEVQIINPSTTTALSGLAFTDTYPFGRNPAGGTMTSQLTNTATPALSNNCGGTATAAAGGTSLALSAGSVGAGASCTISVNVSVAPTLNPTGSLSSSTSPPYASYPNATATIRSDQGVGGTAADTLYLVLKPSITKSFLTSPITLSGGTASSVMRLVVENNYGGGAIANVTFTDIFPTAPGQMVYTSTVANGCSATLTNQSGAALATGSSTGLRVVIPTLAANATCTIDINVTVPVQGTYPNQTTGATSTTAGFTGAGPESNIASLVVNNPTPSATKSFSAAQAGVGANVTMTIVLTNPSAVAATGAAFTDTYPAGLVNAASPSTTNTCGGSVTANAGENSLALAVGTIPASSSCNITVLVTGTAPGALTNSTGPITTANAGTVAAVNATITFFAPPTVTKTITPSSLGKGAQPTLTLTLSNPAGNAGAFTSVAVTDNLALTGLAVASTVVTFTPAACGTVTKNPSGALVVNDSDIRFSVASLAVGASCQASFLVSTSSTGSFTNTTGIPTGVTPPPASVTISGNVASASFTVSAATLTKSWSTSAVVVGTNTNLIFTLTNGTGNPAQSGIAFTESLPSSLQFTTATPVITYGAGCSGSTAVTQGTPDTIAFSNVAMANGTAACTITVAVVTMRPGQTNASCALSPSAFTNSGTNLTSLNNVNSGVTAQCVVVNAATPTLNKAFSANLYVGGTTVLTYTVSQPSANPAQTFSFTDTLPAGLVLAATPAVGGTCTAGTTTATAGAAIFTATNWQIPALTTSCTITVTLTTATTPTAGICPQVNNTNGNGNISATTNITAAITNSATSGTSATGACVTVVASLSPSLVFLKTVSVTSDPVNGVTFPKNIPGAEVLYSLRVTNTGAGTVDSNTTVITDPIPLNTDLFVGDLSGVVNSGPILFVDSSPASGLSWSYLGLNNAGDDVGFYSDAGCTTLMTPTAIAPYFDTTVRCIRMNPKGTMAGASGGNNPYFELRFRVRLK